MYGVAQGVLECSQPAFGYVSYKQALHGFATPESMAKFAASPGAICEYESASGPRG
jgi:hypothetical protein